MLTPASSTPLHWVSAVAPLRLALAAHPRAGPQIAADLQCWRRAGVGKVVSLLPTTEAAELGLTGERSGCEAQGIGFASFPIPDMGTPTRTADARDLVESLVRDLRANVGVVVHCRAGVGRTGLVAACVLTSLGWEVEQAVRILSTARGAALPESQQQMEWLSVFAGGSPGAT